MPEGNEKYARTRVTWDRQEQSERHSQFGGRLTNNEYTVSEYTHEQSSSMISEITSEN